MRRLLTVLIPLLAVVSCGGTGSPASSRPVIGATLLTGTHAFYKDLEAGMREAAAAKGFDLTVVACEMDPAKQASQIEDLVARRVRALIVAPCDSSAVVPALGAPERAGIPIFTVDIAAHGGKIVSHVASDNLAGGRLAAEALATRIGGKGKVVIIDHPTVASVQDRVKGFEEVMARYPDITIVARPSADGQRARATQIMEDMLQAHRDLKGVFGINDDSALGAANVIEAAGRRDIVVVGFDATEEAQAAIRRGSPLEADIAQHPRRIGETAIDIIARHLSGEAVPAVVAVEVEVVDESTLAAK
ncbi:MAG: substrate-binding domain-containing protein [Acidobacteria bacterium]|nr:substrate-binding domain-containing protein [Acidobacteriota bacterium]